MTKRVYFNTPQRLTQLIGANTTACLQSGAVFGTAATLDGMNARIVQELGYEAPVVVTGGLGRT